MLTCYLIFIGYEITPMDDLIIEENFPAVITARHTLHFKEFLKILEKNQTKISHLLLKNGALLFRGFPVDSASRFSEVIKTLQYGQFVDYIGGDSPRDKVCEGIYTSTEAPPNFHIPLHQELSFVKYFPKHIYFFCEIAPKAVGETIIADARRVYQSLDKKIINTFQQKRFDLCFSLLL